MAKITVQNTEITVLSYNDKDYISLTGLPSFVMSVSGLKRLMPLVYV